MASDNPGIGEEFIEILSVLDSLCVSKNTLYSSKFRLCLRILSKFMTTRIIRGSDKEIVKLWLSTEDSSLTQEYKSSRINPFFKGILDSKEYNEMPKSTVEFVCLEAGNFITSSEHTLQWCAEFLHFLVQNIYDGYVFSFLC